MNKLETFLIRLASLILFALRFLRINALFFSAFSMWTILDNMPYSCSTELG
jgi:hypothetical protein